MIDLLKADLYRLSRWKFFYLGLFLLTGADILFEGAKRIIQKEQISFLEMMISGTEQKILFLAVAIFIGCYLHQERESGFLRQIQPLYPKWKQMAEKIILGALVSLFVEGFFFAEHLGKAVYFQMTWTGIELIEGEAFFVGNIFLSAAFATASICLAEWIKNIWISAVLLFLLVWGWPLHLAFEKMLEVFGGTGILRYGMFETCSRFCQEIQEGTFLQTILISCIWIAGFGGFALLGKLRR